MTPERLPDGTLLVPLRGVSDDGVVADGLCPIGPDHSDYQLWSDYLDALDVRKGAPEGLEVPDQLAPLASRARRPQ